MPEIIVPLVLAAGDSRRMGRTKALLDFDGRTAIEIVLAAHREAADAAQAAGVTLAPPVVVLGRDAEAVRPHLPEGVRAVVNPAPERGRTSSIRAGLEAIEASLSPESPGTAGGLDAEAEAFLLHPVDSPLVAAETIARIVGDASGRPIVVPVFEGRRGHPALFRRAVFAEFHALGDDEPAHVVVRRDASRVCEVAVEDENVARRLNTPGEYRAALAAFRAATKRG